MARGIWRSHRNRSTSRDASIVAASPGRGGNADLGAKFPEAYFRRAGPRAHERFGPEIPAGSYPLGCQREFGRYSARGAPEGWPSG